MREGTYRGQPSDWSARVGFCWIGDKQLEIIQPLNGPSIYYEHLEKKAKVFIMLKNGWMTVKK